MSEELENTKEPINELSRPAVIDLETLLQPVSEEKPAGEYLRYSGVYDEMGEARRADDILGQEDVQSELKVADFAKVIELAVPVIEKESKDLQISAWLSEALVKQHGFAGLRDSLKLLSGLQNEFWEGLYPEIDEGDMEGRANALDWMDRENALAIKEAKITAGEGYNFLDYHDSKKFDIPENTDLLDTAEQQKVKALAAQAEKENRVTADKWKKATARSNRAFYEELDVAITECLDELKTLNRVIEEKFDTNQAPSLPNLKKTLDDIKSRTDKLLKQKRVEEPDAIEQNLEIEEDGAEGGNEGRGVAGTMSSSKGTINNRKEALKRLSELAEFFRKTEPHSPVSYLITRAVKWGNMPLETWLKDVIKDEAILFQLRQTLGFNTNTDDTGENVAASDPTAVEDQHPTTSV